MGLCQYVDLCFHASSLPCLHTFWHAIPTSFYIFNVLVSSITALQVDIAIKSQGRRSRGGGGGGGGGGAIALAPPKMTDGIYQSETRWQIKYLAYSSEMAIATIYTHSKLAQLTDACNPDRNIGSLFNQRVCAFVSELSLKTHHRTHRCMRLRVRCSSASRLLNFTM